MKKMLAICMTLIMSISSISIAFAKETQTEEPLLGATKILNVKTEDSGSKVYTATYGDVQNLVTERTVADGVLYIFEQDDLKNELLITKNDEMYLDGELVKVTVIPAEETVAYMSEGISPIAFYDYWEVGTSPFASGSYTYGKQTSKVRIELGRQISSVTLGTFAGIVSNALFPGSGALVGPFSVSIYYHILKENSPAETSAYIKMTKWHNNAPEISADRQKVFYKILLEGYYDSDFDEPTSYSETKYAVYHAVSH